MAKGLQEEIVLADVSDDANEAEVIPTSPEPACVLSQSEFDGGVVQSFDSVESICDAFESQVRGLQDIAKGCVSIKPETVVLLRRKFASLLQFEGSWDAAKAEEICAMLDQL